MVVNLGPRKGLSTADAPISWHLSCQHAGLGAPDQPGWPFQLRRQALGPDVSPRGQTPLGRKVRDSTGGLVQEKWKSL